MLVIFTQVAFYSAVAIFTLFINYGYASALCENNHKNIFVSNTTPTSDFIDNGNGTVTHLITGLIWQRCSVGQYWDGKSCVGKATDFTWYEALQQARDNKYLNYDDWYLPNKNELASIIEFSCFQPAVNAALFPNTPSWSYWSSSPNDYNDFMTGGAWYISFYNVYINSIDKGNSFYVRLVRASEE